MTLPETLQELLQRAQAAVERHPQHDLNLGYRQALPRLGPPARDEVYAYVPTLALGGAEDASALQKVKLREHLSFLAQLSG